MYKYLHRRTHACPRTHTTAAAAATTT